jgi:tRNA(Arg) A34 adenosine deaminase TadA
MDCEPKIRQLSKKEKKYVDLAKRISYQSGYSHRHGAVLIKGASIINVSCNKNKFSSFATRFTKKEKEFVTVHAELGSILNVERTHTEGATVYVVRVNNQDELRLSKPCPMCEEAMRFVGIKKVVYSTSEDTFEEMKL